MSAEGRGRLRMWEIEDQPSPNYGPRRDGALPDMVVLHYTGMATVEEAIARMRDPATEVSAHYLVDVDGRVVRLVAEEMRAWHAGIAAWGCVTDVNSCSIGVEIVNPGHEFGYPPFPDPQMGAIEELLRDILERHRIAPERVLGHSCVAPGRKRDPGEKFDWRRLARSDLSIWLDPPLHAEGAADALRFQASAQAFGYCVPANGEWCIDTLHVWRAYLARFVPYDADAQPNGAGIVHLERLAARWPATRNT